MDQFVVLIKRVSTAPSATIADLDDYPFPRGDDPGRFAGMRAQAMRIHKETPYAVVSGISGVVYEICWYLRGLENLFIDMMERPEILEALLDRTLAAMRSTLAPG